MSQPFSRILHPFDVERHPRLEPEVAGALLARWALDRTAPCDRPAFRGPAGANCTSPAGGERATLAVVDRRGGEHPRPR